ncbi:MAG: GNAT family N-acetyltransferase [Bacilli bacterium]|nr:GNAT family N-acetyltransferase [Bacilli bacterium]MBN2697168.1 GNAT family N-acetyltransferase [Bacilli bacterium]
MDIRILDREKYKSKKFQVEYFTSSWYIPYSTKGDSYEVEWRKAVFGEPQKKAFDIELYPDYFPEAIALGCFAEEELVGLIEFYPESWNKRLRVTEIWVKDDFRNKGIGSELLEHAKNNAKANGFRMIVLETQSCNVNAIDFYKKNGYEIIGYDKFCYTNQDSLKHEVRLEMGIKVIENE